MRLAQLRWSEVNFDTSTVTIPTSRTKSGRQLQLTLPTPAMDLLRERREKQIANSCLVRPGASFSRWSYEKMAIDKRLVESGHRLEPWTLHDLRRTMRTRLGKIGIEPTSPNS